MLVRSSWGIFSFLLFPWCKQFVNQLPNRWKIGFAVKPIAEQDPNVGWMIWNRVIFSVVSTGSTFVNDRLPYRSIFVPLTTHQTSMNFLTSTSKSVNNSRYNNNLNLFCWSLCWRLKNNFIFYSICSRASQRRWCLYLQGLGFHQLYFQALRRADATRCSSLAHEKVDIGLLRSEIYSLLVNSFKTNDPLALFLHYPLVRNYRISFFFFFLFESIRLGRKVFNGR